MKLWQFLSVILILSISPLEISGQNNSGIVSGSVFNSGQEPLVGVSVFVKVTNIWTFFCKGRGRTKSGISLYRL